jgi:hypothetical protein
VLRCGADDAELLLRHFRWAPASRVHEEWFQARPTRAAAPRARANGRGGARDAREKAHADAAVCPLVWLCRTKPPCAPRRACRPLRRRMTARATQAARCGTRHGPRRSLSLRLSRCFPQPPGAFVPPDARRGGAATAHLRHLLRGLPARGPGRLRVRPRLLQRLLGGCVRSLFPHSARQQRLTLRRPRAGYARASLGDGPAVLSLRCAAPGCGVAAPAPLLCSLFTPPERERYDAYRLRSFVENNARVRWCPGAGCGRAVERAGGGGGGAPEDVVCAQPPAGCGAVFCWSCGAEAHRPLACDTVRAWLLKNSAESENMTWCAGCAANARTHASALSLCKPTGSWRIRSRAPSAAGRLRRARGACT